MFWQNDKAPFLITVFVAAFGWAAVHTVDRLVESPAIEYNISSEIVNGAPPDTYEVKAKITNLSKETTFREINFLFRVPKESQSVRFLAQPNDINYTRIETKAPALEATSTGERPNYAVDNNGASFILPVLAPGSEYNLVTRYRGTGRPVFQGMPNLHADDSFALVSASPLTWIAKNELSFLWSCIGVWLLAMSIYWFGWRDRAMHAIPN